MLPLNNYDYESKKKAIVNLSNFQFSVASPMTLRMRHRIQMASKRIQFNAYIDQRQKSYKNATFGDVALTLHSQSLSVNEPLH